MTGKPLLQTRGLVKRFGGITALNGVDFDLNGGEVHGLCGENGAGKSTLIKILSGIHPYGSYQGEIFVDGSPMRFESIRDSEAAGIAVIHQELALVEEMTVAENIFLGHEPTRLGLLDHDRMYGNAQRLLDRFHIDVPANRRVAELGIGQKQLVEIAKALERDSKVLILDEPSAALTEREVEVLLDIVRDLERSGVACVYISHKLGEIFAVADRITVLRDGETVARLSARESGRDEVIRHMVGREITDLFPRRKPPFGEVLLRVSHLTVAPSRRTPARLRDIGFEVRAGEVLGIGGLMGAGRSELLQHLFGAWGARIDGTVSLCGEALATSPNQCIRQGVVLVSEDRKRYGLVLGQTVGFNLSLSSLLELSHAGLIDRDKEAAENQRTAESLSIKTPHLETVTQTLSGGNQQKVVLGKALMTAPRVLLLDEPTRGIDVGAKQEIYELVNQLTERGLAVVMVSSELPELIGMSDRILILADGEVGGLFDASTATQEQLLAAAMKVRTPSHSSPPTPRSVDTFIPMNSNANATVAVRDFSMLIALLLIAVYFWLQDPAFLSSRNLSQLAIELASTAVLALGMLLVILPGHIDLSVGSGLGLAGGIAAVLTLEHNWPAPLALACTTVLSIGLYAAMGTIIVRERIPAFIITLGGLLVFKGAHWLVIENKTVPVVQGGETNLYSLLTTYYVPPMLSWAIATLLIALLAAATANANRHRRQRGLPVDRESVFLRWFLSAQVITLFVLVMNQYKGVPLSALILGATALAVHVVTQHSRLGRYLYAIGGNEEAAIVSGVPTEKVVIGAFAIMGIVVAVAGYLQTAFAGATTTTTGQLMELDAIAACVIGGTSLKGGRGDVVGVLFGALIMATLLNGMTLLAFSPELKFIARGVVLALAVWMDVRLSRDS